VRQGISIISSTAIIFFNRVHLGLFDFEVQKQRNFCGLTKLFGVIVLQQLFGSHTVGISPQTSIFQTGRSLLHLPLPLFT